ncbi:MAG: hypothetical protein WDA74_01265 [Spirochaetota bacterium]
MTDKNKKENFRSDISSAGNGKLSDDLKKRISVNLPEEIDISSIGNIDLHEAEKIANEEIVFLTEDDLIEGLEDFELIPLKNAAGNAESKEEKNDSKEKDLPGLRIKDISEAVSTEEVLVKTDNDNEVLFEDFNNDTPDEEIIPDIIDEIDEKIEFESVDEVKSEETIEEEIIPVESDEPQISDVKPPEQESSLDIETDIFSDDPVFSQDKELLDEPVIDKESAEALMVEKPAVLITENSINIQFEEIFKEITAEKENIPMRFSSEVNAYNNSKFIDDVLVHKTDKDAVRAYSGDPLTERLSRIIHVSDSPMSVITEKTDYYNDHTYILEDTTLYDRSVAFTADKDEIFYSDSDLDFIENAIIKNDFSRFIQEIDDYYDVSKIETESQITEILGLNSEEREIIDDSLFSEYYSKIDFDSEIDFLNPDLDFINRSYVRNKSVSYLLDDPDSLFEDEKDSIEDDISSGTAIVFEEDVEDLKFLFEKNYGSDPGGKDESDNLLKAAEKDVEAALKEFSSPVSDDLALDSQDIINITDQVIILEDRDNVEAFTSQFPEKKEDLVKLLSYLDGLFEKLPEEAVKKFAQSEYFDLYVKVMNEIGA